MSLLGSGGFESDVKGSAVAPGQEAEQHALELRILEAQWLNDERIFREILREQEKKYIAQTDMLHMALKREHEEKQKLQMANRRDAEERQSMRMAREQEKEKERELAITNMQLQLEIDRLMLTHDVLNLAKKMCFRCNFCSSPPSYLWA